MTLLTYLAQALLSAVLAYGDHDAHIAHIEAAGPTCGTAFDQWLTWPATDPAGRDAAWVTLTEVC